MKKGAINMKYYMFNGLSPNERANKPKKELNKKKVWKTVIAFLCIVLVISFIILYTTNETCSEVFDKYVFRKEVQENNLPSIEIDSTKNINVCTYDRFIGILEQNVLNIYNKSGNQEHSLDIEISNPIFQTNGEYLCIAEKKGQKIYLIKNKNIIWQNEIEGNISSINVNKNGYVSITISGKTYKTVVATYDQNGKELFKTYLSTTNVIDTDISNDNKYLAIAEANFSGIVVQSSIKIIFIEDAKKNSSESIKYTHIAETDDLITNIKYHSKNKLICMYDEHIDIFNEGNNTEIINLRDGNVLFSDINLSDKIVKIEKKSTGVFSAEAEMKIVNTNTQKETIYAIDNVPKSIYIQGDMIAVNLGTSALFINDSGWLVKKYESSHEIQEIVLCNNVATIISKNKIEIVSL